MTSPGDTGHSPERTRTSWLASVSSKFIQKDFTDFAGWVQIVAGKSPRRNDSRTDDPKVTVRCAWADTWRGRFWAKGGIIEHP
jgi:hypothetical protein